MCPFENNHIKLIHIVHLEYVVINHNEVRWDVRERKIYKCSI